MLQILTTDELAEWFASLDEATAEDVATAVEVVEQLGVARAAPGSRESLLWYEHPSVSTFEDRRAFPWDLESWGCVRDYAHQVLTQLESRRFLAQLARIPSKQAEAVLQAVKQLRRAADLRSLWTLASRAGRAPLPSGEGAMEACAELRRLYFAALEAAGFEVADVPAHSLALREVARRLPAPGFRLLYGVHAQRETALFVLGERLDRSFYGHSVRRAERAWKQFLDGTLQAVEPAQFR